ncbi:MAG: cysteine--tRNA ligase [Candidatus Dormibacteraeota bacterium]|nr:cysteine--tRNA ligase [Candidatus Dormibacteraeota bacterium]MBV9525925.1 cysteine--tRNA ligase [Candidatus Dormibacteraeota bacterium]
MRLHDTARGAVLPFVPRGESASIYVCGITPYDAAHLGHAFTYHVFDVLTRRLIDSGVRVRSVRNVTDVDDDMLRVARERGADYRAIGDDQVQRFDRDMAEIGLLPVSAAPRAGAHVPEMVQWIERLVEGGFAYDVDGWVYFEVQRFPAYGGLSHLDRDTMIRLSRERGADPGDVRKRDALDFVLWQPSLPDEPRWQSPWSDGRPGWHIECSVLATRELGTPVDIHGGGDDLIYPHHESEIAQAEAAGPTPYVRHWTHVAMVRHQGEKMSKSLGNLVFVRELLEHVPGTTIRLLLAAHHYRESWTYDAEEVSAADDRRRRYEEALRAPAALDAGEAGDLLRQFRERLDDDLDTPGALRVLDLAAAAALRSGHGGGVEPAEMLGPMLGLLGARPAAAPVAS